MLGLGLGFLLPPAAVSPGPNCGVGPGSSSAALVDQKEHTVSKSFSFYLNFLNSHSQCAVQVLLRFLSQVRRSCVAGQAIPFGLLSFSTIRPASLVSEII